MNSTSPDTQAPSKRRIPVNEIVAGAAVLALLYGAREVLVPITLAIMLSLMILPLVRALRHVGLGLTGAVLTAVCALAIFLAAIATVIGLQLGYVAASLPQYEQTIRSKVTALREVTLDRMSAMQGEAWRVIDHFSEPSTRGVVTQARGQTLALTERPIPVQIQEPPDSPQKIIAQILSSSWGLLQTTGVVLVVLVFVLLDYEALRDRLIRLLGATDLRATTEAINDATERLSRYFASQFAVNFGVGALTWLGLFIIGFPHAALWATLTAILRFVPFAGVLAAAASAGLVAAAVVPGWSMALMTLGIYFVVETIATQFIEPNLYGHHTGLSPVSIVIGAIFWSWLWGPIGLIVSTPLTLFLVVLGHHVQDLYFLDILLGDAPALTMAQKFYQRALSGDAHEIIATARVFLKRRSFAAYCDVVLMRALHLASLDFLAGKINKELQKKVTHALVSVLEGLGPEMGKQTRKGHGNNLDHTNLTRHLQRQRERTGGRWQGPLAVPAGSVVLGLGLGSLGNDLATEILVRILRDLHIDARHLSVEALGEGPPVGATSASVAMVCVVSLAPDAEHAFKGGVSARIKQLFPEAMSVAVLLPGAQPHLRHALVSDPFDLVLGSFEEVAQHALTCVLPGK